MENKRLLYVALDSESQRENYDNAASLADNVSGNYGFKINLDSVVDLSENALSPYRMLKAIQEFRRPIFVDMKMWNGKRTMSKIAEQCAELGIDIINMRPQSGEKFYKGVLSVLEGSRTKLFGLTVETHYTDADTQRLYGKNLRDTTKMLADMNVEFGADGVILPGTTLDICQEITLSKLVPAVRPSWFEDKKANNQEQTVTPKYAFDNGAEIIVCGSPIFKSKNPVEALERILEENKLRTTIN